MQLDKILHELHHEESTVQRLAKLTRPFLDIETLKKEQNYQGFDEARFDNLIK
jgi:hypothetical protein